uniref:Chorein_N domain-containing protein n=1 Tax=Elaeophora elaphi TaxID=1147741 RepID=A0A0R3RR71_9BILA
MLSEKLTKWCMGIREKLLSLVIAFEGRNSLHIVVWIENWMKIVEASIAVDLEVCDKKDSNDIYVQIEDSRTVAEDLVTVPKELVNFKSKALINRENVYLADRWDQISKELKSGTVQIETGKILVDVSCQVEDLAVSVDNQTSVSKDSVTFFSTNSCNKVVIAQENAETKSMGSSCHPMNPEDAKEMQNIFVADESFSLYTFGQMEGMREESGDVRSENSTSFSTSMQIKCSDKFTKTKSQRETCGVQFADYLNEIDVEIGGGSQVKASTSIEYVAEIVTSAEPVILTGNRDSVSERLKNVFKTLPDEGIEVDEVQCDMDIRNNIQMITASNPWPSLMHRLHRYLRTLPHRRNAIRLILRYLLGFYFILLHGAFLRCSIF